MLDFRLLTGAFLATMAIVVIGFRLFGANDAAAGLVRGEAPRIEMSVLEKPLPLAPVQPLIAVPVWIAPPSPAIELLASIDIEQDTRMDSAAAPAETARAPELAPAGNETEDAAVAIEDAAAAMETAAIADAVQPEDAVPALAASATPAGHAAEIHAGTSDDAAPQTAASIEPREPINASIEASPPEQKPAARPAQARPVKRVAKANRPAARPAQTRPAQPETAANRFPFLFPFANAFAAKGAVATGAGAAVAQPVCCNTD